MRNVGPAGLTAATRTARRLSGMMTKQKLLFPPGDSCDWTGRNRPVYGTVPLAKLWRPRDCTLLPNSESCVATPLLDFGLWYICHILLARTLHHKSLLLDTRSVTTWRWNEVNKKTPTGTEKFHSNCIQISFCGQCESQTGNRPALRIFLYPIYTTGANAVNIFYNW
jgi:hypothetical protein